VSMPFSDPRAALVGLTGRSSIRRRYSIAWSFLPGLIPSASRIVEGITIWHCDDTVMVLIRFSDRSPVCKGEMAAYHGFCGRVARCSQAAKWSDIGYLATRAGVIPVTAVRPARQLSLRPVAIGAVAEVTRRLKPSM